MSASRTPASGRTASIRAAARAEDAAEVRRCRTSCRGYRGSPCSAHCRLRRAPGRTGRPPIEKLFISPRSRMCAAGPSTTPIGELPYSSAAGAAEGGRVEPLRRRRVWTREIADEVGARSPAVAQRGARHADAQRRAGDEAVDAAQLPAAEKRVGDRVHVVQEALVAPERQLVDRSSPTACDDGRSPTAPAQVAGGHERLQPPGLVRRDESDVSFASEYDAGEREPVG